MSYPANLRGWGPGWPDVGQPVAQPRFGDENTVWVVEDPECGGGLVEEPLGDVPDDGPVQFFGED